MKTEVGGLRLARSKGDDSICLTVSPTLLHAYNYALSFCMN